VQTGSSIQPLVQLDCARSFIPRAERDGTGLGDGTPFTSNSLARLSQLPVWFKKQGIYPELRSRRCRLFLTAPANFAGIEPGTFGAAEWGARANAPNAQAGSHHSSGQQHAGTAT